VGRALLPCVRALALVLASAGCAVGEPAAEGSRVAGASAPDEPWRGHDGPFFAQLVLAHGAKALYQTWSAQPGEVPLEPPVRAVPGARVETVVYFARCRPGGDGHCSVWGKATLETSDGRVLAKEVEVALSVDRPPPPGDALGMSEHGIGLVVEDFAGSYTFRVVVTDRVAGREVALVRELVVVRSE
jgi:hypothetical protein